MGQGNPCSIPTKTDCNLKVYLGIIKSFIEEQKLLSRRIECHPQELQ